MFVVIEIQKSAVDQVAALTTTHTTREEAEQKYHTVLAYAAVSNLLSHSATMLDERGSQIKSECYEHIPENSEVTNEVAGI